MFTFYVENVMSYANRLYHRQQFAHIFKLLRWKAYSSFNTKDHPRAKKKKSFLHGLEYFQYSKCIHLRSVYIYVLCACYTWCRRSFLNLWSPGCYPRIPAAGREASALLMAQAAPNFESVCRDPDHSPTPAVFPIKTPATLNSPHTAI